MSRGKLSVYTIEIRYKCGLRNLRRVTSASDATALRRVSENHLDPDRELSSLYIAEKWPKAKKDRQAYLQAKRRAKEEKLEKARQEYADYDGEESS